MNDYIIPREKCTGCKMCSQICNHNAIKFVENREGFWYPSIEFSKCIQCDLCRIKCPINRELKKDMEFGIAAYGAWTLNEKTRINSTSGGIFTELALKWVDKQGFFAGAAYGTNLSVKHKIVEKRELLNQLQQSKYVQSDTEEIYKKVKKLLLDESSKVIFSGTPCQVAALKSFLGKDYKNLLTIDFICCGVPSPKVYKEYINFLEKENNSQVTKIWFKNKTFGWHSLSTKISFRNNKTYLKRSNVDPYMIAYIESGLDLRTSCYQCDFKQNQHYSDITLGDFWGIENIYPQYSDERGVSAVIINTEKGHELFKSIKSEIFCFKTQIDMIAKGNFTLNQSMKDNPKRDEFFSELGTISFDKLIFKYSSCNKNENVKRTIKNYIKQLLKRKIYN